MHFLIPNPQLHVVGDLESENAMQKQKQKKIQLMN